MSPITKVRSMTRQCTAKRSTGCGRTRLRGRAFPPFHVIHLHRKSMRTCPRCGVAYDDATTHCEADWTRLAATDLDVSLPATIAAQAFPGGAAPAPHEIDRLTGRVLGGRYHLVEA